MCICEHMYVFIYLHALFAHTQYVSHDLYHYVQCTLIFYFFQLNNPISGGTAWKHARLCPLLSMLCPWGPRWPLPSLAALPPATCHSIPRPSRRADTHVLRSAPRAGGARLPSSAGAPAGCPQRGVNGLRPSVSSAPRKVSGCELETDTLVND